MLNIFGCSCVCDETMWIGGAHGSYCMKGPREDQVFECETMSLVECLCVFELPLAGVWNR